MPIDINTYEHPAFTRAKALPERVSNFFPKSTLEATNWTPNIIWRALDQTILVVAIPRVECMWKAYIGSVPGINHQNEYNQVYATGSMLDENIARELFPIFKDVPYAD